MPDRGWGELNELCGERASRKPAERSRVVAHPGCRVSTPQVLPVLFEEWGPAYVQRRSEERDVVGREGERRPIEPGRGSQQCSPDAPRRDRLEGRIPDIARRGRV